ncbi:DUF2892 domain-containing protein [Herbaspirillum seropedicae]|uniref:YgaP family membrane protein n=1 Tax=Herbaspirillum seropedicae TaxID=964 RepID=UPI0011219FEA|nr:DUF2892 domain-containing protein [Herbaspirillum seropedicae]QDD65436.1 DUF2892 domain-containing protein [Herbaspirillum seropedicae]
MIFRKNLPQWERAVRLLLGVITVTATFWLSLSATLHWAIASVGALLACSGFIGFCPMCALVGRRRKSHED